MTAWVTPPDRAAPSASVPHRSPVASDDLRPQDHELRVHDLAGRDGSRHSGIDEAAARGGWLDHRRHPRFGRPGMDAPLRASRPSAMPARWRQSLHGLSRLLSRGLVPHRAAGPGNSPVPPAHDRLGAAGQGEGVFGFRVGAPVKQLSRSRSWRRRIPAAPSGGGDLPGTRPSVRLRAYMPRIEPMSPGSSASGTPGFPSAAGSSEG